MGLFGGNKMPVDGKSVLLTGGSEGMGLSVAKMLAAKGANIVIVSRSTDKLKAAVQEIQASAKHPSSQRFHFIAADVATPGYAAAVIEEATKWNNGESLDIVWNVAGFSRPELWVDMDFDSHRRHFDVIYFGTAQMCHAILREWLAPERPVEKQPRHLIMTASTLGFYAIPGYGPYTPAKWALRGLAETLSQEVMLYPQNVKVSVVWPGTILSPGNVHENKNKPEISKILEASDPKQTPDEVAAAAIKGLEAGQYFVTVNWLGDLMKFGVLGGAFRNNWFIDTLGAILVQFVWFFIHIDIHGKIKDYGKKHGHPSTYKKAS